MDGTLKRGDTLQNQLTELKRLKGVVCVSHRSAENISLELSDGVHLVIGSLVETGEM